MLIRQAFAAALCVLALAWPRPAFAFFWLAVPPPITSAIDANGVDLGTGGFTVSAVEVVIGQPQAGGLVYARTFMQLGELHFGWRDNLAGTINLPLSSSTYTVSLNGASESFTFSGGVFTSDQGRGSTLTFDSVAGIYTYRSASGVTALFDVDLAGQQMLPLANVARVTEVTTSAGEVTTYHYASISTSGGTVLRLQSVTNNFGYMLHFQYASNGGGGDVTDLIKVTGINLADSYCAPTATSCTGSVSASYGLEGSGTIETVTDTLGNVTRYAYADGARDQMTGIRRPTSSSTNHVTISYGPSGIDGGVSQVVSGGGTWVYAASEASGVRTVTATNSDSLAAQRVMTVEIATNRILTQSDGVNEIAYDYDDEGRVEAITSTGGIVTSFEYDPRGNVVETRVTSGSELIVTSAVYPETCSDPPEVTCNLPISTTDARGQMTNYTYDSTHGGLRTVTLPDPDGSGTENPLPRPETNYFYEQKTARYFVSSTNTDPGPPIWRLTRVSSCATGSWSGSACVNGAAVETRTNIAYPAASVANISCRRR